MNLCIAFIIVALLLLFFVGGTYNKCVKLLNYVKEAFSTMDVYMKKRWDLIPNLVETVKGYVAHEKGVLEEITALRNTNYTNLSPDEKIDVNNKLAYGLSKLIAVAENYPDLKASSNFTELQTQLSHIEDEIASSRKYYNGCVREFNTYIQIFPSNVIAGIFNFKEQKLFEIDESQRENVKVSF